MRLKTVGKGIFVKKVLGERLLIKSTIPYTQMDEAEIKSKIVIPEYIKKENTPISTYGVVVQVGDGCLHEWHEGDIVLFGKFSGTDFTMSNDDFRVMHENEVLAILDVDLETFGAVPVKE